MLIRNLMTYPHASNVKARLNYDWFQNMTDHLVPYLFSPEGKLDFIWRGYNTDLIQDLFREIMSGKDNKKSWLAILGISIETQPLRWKRNDEVSKIKEYEYRNM